MTLTLISTYTVGAGGAASIDFTSIPQTYTDLKLVFSLRDAQTAAVYNNVGVRFNGVSSGYSERLLLGASSSANSYNNSAQPNFAFIYGNGSASAGTTNTFSNGEMYIPNYAGATNKSVSTESVAVSNSGTYALGIEAGLWANTAAITSISIFPGTSTTWVQYSTASLYGILKGSGGATVS